MDVGHEDTVIGYKYENMIIQVYPLGHDHWNISARVTNNHKAWSLGHDDTVTGV